MRFSLKVISVVFVTLFSIINVNAAEKKETKRVLILVGHSKYQPAVQFVEEGISQVFQADPDYRIKLNIEYLDLYRFTSEQYKQKTAELLRHKYGDRNIDIVITILTSALRFVLDYGDEIFPGVPIVFTVISEPNLVGLDLPGNVTGISYELDIKGNLETVLKLQPDTKQVVLIGGISKTISAMCEKAKKIFKPYEDRLQFIYLTDHSMPQILEQVARLPKDTVIFNMGMYRDRAGNVFVPKEAMADIAAKSNAPSYTFFETLMGSGLVGGRLVGFEMQGRKAAAYALRILKGEKPSDLPVTSHGTIVPMFDWRQLKKWGLDEERLPEGSIVRFKELTTWEEHKRYIILGGALFIIEALLILLLLFNWGRRVKAESALSKSHKELEHRVEERTTELAKRNNQLRKEIEDRKRVEEERDRILNMSSDLICVAGMDGYWKYLNPAWEKMMGYTIEESLARPFRDFIHPEDHNKNDDEVESLTSGNETIGFENRYICKDGSIRVMSWRATSLPETRAMYCIGRDVTEQKKAEDSLRKSEEKYRSMMESMADAVYICSPDYRVQYMNPAMIKKTGGRNAVGELCHKVLHELDEKCPWCVHDKVQQGENHVTEIVSPRDNRTHNISHFPVHNADGSISKLTIDRDVTEKRKIEVELQKATKMEAIATLAGGIAHEFNNALMGVLGTIELLKWDLPEDKRRDEHFEAMNESGHRMSHLTDQLLAYSEGGKYNAKDLKLDDFTIETLPILQHDLNPEVRVETRFQKDISYIRADHVQMQMVLSAILANSNEAMEDEGLIRITAENEDVDEDFAKQHPGLKPGSHVCLTIEDNGKGMDEETKVGIFEPFFTTKFQGRGMGMAAVYGIIKSHDGAITVDSEPGKGTVVHIYLPAVEAKEEAKAVKQPKTEIATGEGTILVIEDEEPLVGLFREILERLGYRALLARTGKEAVELAKTFDGQIDLALLDIKLPDMEGGRVYPLIMKARPDLKVIVCSGYSIHGPAQDILDAGAEGFIQKPFSIAPFAEKMKEVLEGK